MTKNSPAIKNVSSSSADSDFEAIAFKVGDRIFIMRGHDTCPRCGGRGSGPHYRWAKSPEFGPYAYFAHSNGHLPHWHYLGSRTVLPQENEDGTRSERQTANFLAEGSSSYLLRSERLRSSPRDKTCSRCGAEYPETTQRKCDCGGFLILNSRGHYS